jgi:hypothetical protein
MLSYLVTTYQQYVNYMETQKVMGDIIQNSPDGNPELIPISSLPQSISDIKNEVKGG